MNYKAEIHNHLNVVKSIDFTKLISTIILLYGEDQQIDELIRKYGYRTTSEVMKFVDENADLRQNLSAAAHLIHGSSDGRFRIKYCSQHLTQQEIESVGYEYGDLAAELAKYSPDQMQDGWNDVDGRRVYFVRNPALGLWAARSRLPS